MRVMRLIEENFTHKNMNSKLCYANLKNILAT